MAYSHVGASPVPAAPKPRTPKVPQGQFLSQRDLAVIDLNLSIASQDAKRYMEDNHIPSMLKGLMSALMMERPEDPLKYLDNRLQDIKSVGVENINWDTFIRHMHPLNFPPRRELIRDSKVREEDDDEEDYLHRGPYPAYKADVFRLTEMEDE